MFLIEHFNVALRLFKFIGIAPIARNEKRTKLKKFLHNIPIFVSSAFMLCVAAYLLLFPHFTPYSSVYTIISYSSTVSFILIIFTANVQCYYYNSVYQSMNYRIREIEKRCRNEFWTKCPKNIQFRYKLKILLIFFLFFLSQGLVFIEVLLNGSRLWSSFLTSFLRLIYPIAVLHVIIYSDIVAMFVLEVNAQIRNSSTFVHSSNKIEVLKNIKLMHMDVFMLVVQINRFFGWNLLLLVINSFIYIIRQLYWIFLALQLQWQSLAVIEGSFSFLYGITTLFVLVNSCQSGSLKIKYLIESIELYAFWTTDNVQLHYLKQEMFSQIVDLPIYITGSEFFTIDRPYLAGIIANCSMYIIIFIQFFVSSHV